jgi:serine/threonine protein kinase
MSGDLLVEYAANEGREMADETGTRRSDDRPAGAGQGQAGPETVPGNLPPADMPAQLGRYRIKKRLGGGGMGAVYLVENTELQREEALKVPHFERGSDPAVRERFLREARAAARLDHPNLCSIYDAGVIDGIHFLTMRLLPGKPLSAYTRRTHPPGEVIKVIVRLAQALEHAHAKGVIHRDLKSSNVMLCPGTGPTVFDFGLAKQVLQPQQKLTQTGMAMGTPAYMPPEQVRGELDRMGPASDVYSLGVILFELLTAELPFRGSTAEVMGQILFAQPPLPSQLRPGLSPMLDAVCGKVMAKAPENRYPSMKDFAAALQDVLNSLTAREPAVAEVTTTGGSKAGDIFDLPTAPPEPPPVVPTQPPENKREPRPSRTTIFDPLTPDEPKARKLGRERQVADAPPLASTRRPSLVLWLCLLLLVGGGAVFGLSILRGDRANNHEDKGDKTAVKEKEVQKEEGYVDKEEGKKVFRVIVRPKKKKR